MPNMNFFVMVDSLLSQSLLEALKREHVSTVSVDRIESVSALLNIPVAGKLSTVDVIFYARKDFEFFKNLQTTFPYAIYIEIQEQEFNSYLEFAELAIQLSLPGLAQVVTCAKEKLSANPVELNNTSIQLVAYLQELLSCKKLINKDFFLTEQDYSFLHRNTKETELILGTKHPGSFGFERKNHIHEGVDIYSTPEEDVYNIFEGILIGIRPFTGEHTALVEITPSPWWNNTFCILVQTKFGVINYGEITPNPCLKKGQYIQKGAFLGKVCRVLKTDKGRPLDMVHLERYISSVTVPVVEWSRGQKRPSGLLAPTNLLLGLCLNED